MREDFSDRRCGDARARDYLQIWPVFLSTTVTVLHFGPDIDVDDDGAINHWQWIAATSKQQLSSPTSAEQPGPG